MLRRTLILAAGALCAPPIAHAETAGPVRLLYAGSLVNLVEHGLAPTFARSGGGRLEGFAGGSNALANQIKGRLRRGDVFISANPRVDEALMGAPNGAWVSWYVTFARSPLVIGYNPSSRFAAELQRRPWYEALQAAGLKLGRTDPKLDPKGALTVELLTHAEAVYKIPGLAQKVLGAPDNPDQVRPEENLVGRLQSGQIDAGFFYSTETHDLHIPAIALPPEVALGARYTATLLRDAPEPEAAERFLAFLFGSEGQAVLRAHGLEVMRPVVSGDPAAIPAGLRPLLSLGG